jgi:hypothetical protein
MSVALRTITHCRLVAAFAVLMVMVIALSAPTSARASGTTGVTLMAQAPAYADSQLTIGWKTNAVTTTQMRWDTRGHHSDFAAYPHDASYGSSRTGSIHSRTLRDLPAGTYYVAICAGTCTAPGSFEQVAAITVGSVTTHDSLVSGVRTDGTEVTAATSLTNLDGSARTWIAGDFDRVGTKAKYGLAVTGVGTGMSGTPFPNGSVTAITDDGDGGWYIGGDFTSVGGLAIPNVAHILSDGGVDPFFVSSGMMAADVQGGVDGAGTRKIYTLEFDARDQPGDAYAGQPRLYVGGDFEWEEGNTVRTTAGYTSCDIVALKTWDDAGADIPGNVLDDFWATTDCYAPAAQVRTILADPRVAGTTGDPAADRWDDNAGVYVGGSFIELNVHDPGNDDPTPQFNLMSWISYAGLAKLEPNGDRASGLVTKGLTSNRNVFVGQGLLGSSPVTVTSLAYDKDLSGDTDFTGIKHSTRIIVAGTFTSVMPYKYSGSAWVPVSGNSTDELPIARVAVIDSVVGLGVNNCAGFGVSSCTIANPDPLPGGGANGPVEQLALTGNRLFVTGTFSQLGGIDAAHATSGVGEYTLNSTSVATWSANTASPILGKVAGSAVKSMSLTGDGASLYLAGTFTLAAGQKHDGLIRLDLADGTVAPYIGGARDAKATYAGASGTSVYVAGDFTMFNGVTSHGIAAIDRDADGKVSVASGFQVPTGTIARINTLSATPSRLYVGGQFSIGSHSNLMALNPITGQAQTFTADPNAQVNRVLAVGQGATNGVWVSGSFTGIANSSTCGGCAGLAYLDGSGGSALSTGPTDLNATGSITSLTEDPQTGDVFVGGSFTVADTTTALAKFTSTGAPATGFVPALGSTPSVKALAFADGALFAAGPANWRSDTPNSIVKMSPVDGSLDEAFGRGIQMTPTTGQVDQLVIADQWLVASGSFTGLQSATQVDVALLDRALGRVYTRVQPQLRQGDASPGVVNAVAPVGDRILIGGKFASYESRGERGGLAVTPDTGDSSPPAVTLSVTRGSVADLTRIVQTGNDWSVVAPAVSGLKVNVGMTATETSPADYGFITSSTVVDPNFGVAFAPWWTPTPSSNSLGATLQTRALQYTVDPTKSPDTEPHRLWTTATDQANHATVPAYVDLYVDGVSPNDPSINRDAADGTRTLAGKIRPDDDRGAAGLGAIKAEFGTASFAADHSCGSTPATYQTPTQLAAVGTAGQDYSYSFTGTADGCARVRARIEDDFGTANTNVEGAWVKVDATAPTWTTFGGGAPNPAAPAWAKQAAGFDVAADADDAGAGVTAITIGESGQPAQCPHTFAATSTVHKTCHFSLADGPHTIMFKAKDDSGTALFGGNSISSTSVVNVDGTKPVVGGVTLSTGSSDALVDTTPGGQQRIWIKGGSTGTFTAVAASSDPAPNGIASGVVRTSFPSAGSGGMSGGDSASGSMGYAWNAATVYAPGSVGGAVEDAVGNVSANTFNFTVAVDNDPPEAAVGSFTLPASPVNSSFDVAGSIRDTGRGLKTYQVGIAGTPGGSITDVLCSGANAAWGTSWVAIDPCHVDLLNGTYEIIVSATDKFDRPAELQRGTVVVQGRSGLHVDYGARTQPLDIYEAGAEPVGDAATRFYHLSMAGHLRGGQTVTVQAQAPARTHVAVVGNPVGDVAMNFTSADEVYVVEVTQDSDPHADGTSSATITNKVTASVGITVQDETTSIRYHDANRAEVQLSSTAGLHASEDRTAAATYTIRLLTPPRNPVSVAVTAPHFDAVPAMLFEPTSGGANGWDVQRTVSLLPNAGDVDVQGPAGRTITVENVVSGDTAYAADAQIAPFTVTIDDVNHAGVTIDHAVAPRVAEAPSSSGETLTMTLDAHPDQDVTVNFSDVAHQLAVSGDTTFSAAGDDWKTPHRVVVRGLDDTIPELPSSAVLHPALVSGDQHFNGFAASDIGFAIDDNDIPGLHLLPKSGWNLKNGNLQLPEGAKDDAQALVHVDTGLVGNISVTPVVGEGAPVKVTSVTRTLAAGAAPADLVFVVHALDNEDVASAAVTGTIEWKVKSDDPNYDANAMAIPATRYTVIDDESPPRTVRTADPAPDAGQPSATPPASPNPPSPRSDGQASTTPVPSIPTPVTNDAAPSPHIPAPDSTGDLQEPVEPVRTPRTDTARVADRGVTGSVGHWARNHKAAAAATTATAIAVGAGVVAKAVAVKGLAGMAGNASGGGHGIGSILDKLRHVTKTRRLRVRKRRLDERVPRRRRRSSETSARERSGMHRDIFEELDEKYSPQYEDPLDKFDDAA